jgi:DNA-binding PadR family transcriptional regulator
MSFRNFVLGLLVQQPMSGYDIKNLLGQLDWLIGGSSFGNIYPTLHALLQNGLASVDVVDGHDKPSKKVYSATESGWEAFQEWRDQVDTANTSLKAFVLRLMLMDDLSREELLAHLRRRREGISAQCADLERAAAEMDGNMNVGRRLTFDYGEAMAAAELAWLDDLIDRLSGQTLDAMAEQGGRKRLFSADPVGGFP